MYSMTILGASPSPPLPSTPPIASHRGSLSRPHSPLKAVAAAHAHPAADAAVEPTRRSSRLNKLNWNAGGRRGMLLVSWVNYQVGKAVPGVHSLTMLVAAGTWVGFLVMVVHWARLQGQQVAPSWDGCLVAVQSLAAYNVIVIEGVLFVATLVGLALFAWASPPMDGLPVSLISGVPARPWQDYLDIDMGVCCLIMIFYAVALINHCRQPKLSWLEMLAVCCHTLMHFLVKGVGYAAFWHPDAGLVSWVLWVIFVCITLAQFLVSYIGIGLGEVHTEVYDGDAVLDNLPLLASEPGEADRAE